MQKKKLLQSNTIFSPATPCAYYIHLSLASIFLLFPAGGGIRGGLDFSYRFKYPFIMDTNFHLSPGVDFPTLAIVPWFKNAYRFSDYEPDEIPGYAGPPP
ncbi:MAG: hypothetical protein AYP45_12290 [Candidatus Brocadia carolinensis]|uniref:Uncharacterized protein n=1 Tax=Candidatus Brocadia carolinensis TaxID=1004156 RepID=A0A1V4ARZ3_9BACT|nr:MAG: hypothetical protein AYP45_12290 [Candidatus Brocadia caroliniensis]